MIQPAFARGVFEYHSPVLTVKEFPPEVFARRSLRPFMYL